VNDGFGSLRGFLAMAKASIFNRYVDRGALDLLNAPIANSAPLVQIDASAVKQESMQETGA
jgi:hypothetical protein